MLSAFLLAKSYSGPIEAFRKAAASFTSGKFDKKVKYKRRDEFTDTFALINKSIEEASVTRDSYKKIEKRITTLLQAVHESIILIEPSGNISSYNLATVKLLKCPPDTDFRKYFNKIKSNSLELRRIIKHALDGKEDHDGQQIALFTSDEDHLLLRVSTQVFREGEQISGVLLNFKDMHVLNELEHNLQRSMKFGLIAALASSINHEIRTPLSSLAMHTKIIRGRLEKLKLKANDGAFKSLGILKNELERIQRILDQFFDLARSRQSNLVRLNINGVVNDVLVLVQQQAIERNITIKPELKETIEFIYGDPDQLKQVILNIVLNGFQAIGRDGTLHIRTRQSDSRIFVEIQDTGKGMPPEVQEHLFELYYSTKPDGGGIGLVVCKNIMEAHEGRISFTTTEGKGTVFILDFPNEELTKTRRKLVNTTHSS
jgi:signal transduction histidine kinase